MKKERSVKKEQPKSNPVYAGIAKLLFEVLKYFLQDVEFFQAHKKKDETVEQYDTLKSMIGKLDKKISNYRKEIEMLKLRVLWGNILFLLLLIVLIINLFIV